MCELCLTTMMCWSPGYFVSHRKKYVRFHSIKLETTCMLQWFLSFRFSLTLYLLSVFRTWAYSVSRRRMWMRPSLVGCRPIITPSTVSAHAERRVCDTKHALCCCPFSVKSLCEKFMCSLERAPKCPAQIYRLWFHWASTDISVVNFIDKSKK